ncbi:MAG: hypothetical protein Q9217_006996, partial [Psora testacea]
RPTPPLLHFPSPTYKLIDPHSVQSGPPRAAIDIDFLKFQLDEKLPLGKILQRQLVTHAITTSGDHITPPFQVRRRAFHAMSTLGRTYQGMEDLSKNMEGATQEMGQQQQQQSHKRKRDSPDRNGRSLRQGPLPDIAQRNGQVALELQRNYFSHQNSNDLNSITREVARQVANANATPSSAAAALAASMPQLTVPQPTELSFPSTNSGNEEDRHIDASFDMGPDHSNQHSEGAPYNLGAYTGANGDQTSMPPAGGNPNKPAVGTDEWHKVRKDNHKEVERRRRETINEGINELAKIVPGCDKNKGAILQRGVQYITQLKDNETRNIEKWTLEKLLTDQAIQELSANIDKLKEELRKAREEADRWRIKAEEAGVDMDEVNTAGADKQHSR